MINKMSQKVLVMITMVVLISACSHNSIYRENFDSMCEFSGPGLCEKATLQNFSASSHDEYHLAFVEYNDQGQLRAPDQMKAVIKKYNELAAYDDVLLVTYVHGWHHSAKGGLNEDSNIVEFRKMLRSVSRQESTASKDQNRNKRKVLGVYVGWRGDSVDVDYVNAVTFWDRKNTAHEVGQQGVTELLLKLEEIVNVKKAINDGSSSFTSSRFVVIGHSFGGAVVFGSLQKILADRFIDSRSDKNYVDDAKGFADLVVLINPAFEAIRFNALYDLSQRYCRKYSDTQLPKLAIMTSESDLATKIAFPVGRFFSTLLESHTTLKRHYCSGPGSDNKVATEISEGIADRTAVGHFSPYITHELEYIEESNRVARNTNARVIQKSWAYNKGNILFDGSQLKSLNKTTNLNPYLNIKVDEALIGSHNDIWGDEIIAFVRDLIVISTTPQQKQTLLKKE